ncbi:MAG: TIGR00159 family protein [Richelia sp. RM2_1_2]|nr:TIGR00159 family protein [Richelia sp. SM2_1_7]NJM19705.1 TIGR00159 family protein [Richelia sp. SM1_7_0]NJN07608.1 TIGR00159 family protein [Richelia sp. RM1_1_1]NJO28497.1 TIGR00159 family protein [Richelia sp. SL_2_1]NJO56924.1 TIGR00159 family protein [Richelia sp. RM2_1_2]
MGNLWKQWLANLGWSQSLLKTLDIMLVLALTYMMLVFISERRTLWMVRGFIVLMLASAVSGSLQLELLNFVLQSLVYGCAVAMAITLQSEFRRFLEQLGRGEFRQLFQTSSLAVPKSYSVIDEIVDAVKELSKNRIGALLIVETTGPIDERDFSVPGVKLNAEVSKELLQTIFQPKTLLHDGATLIRGSRIVSSGIILPLSGRTASRQLGTRHRAAMGITERVENCICVVVSEETGSISLAERGTLNRPLTITKLRDSLETRFSPAVDREAVAPGLFSLGRQIRDKSTALISRLLGLASTASRNKK